MRVGAAIVLRRVIFLEEIEMNEEKLRWKCLQRREIKNEHLPNAQCVALKMFAAPLLRQQRRGDLFHLRCIYVRIARHTKSNRAFA